jgi:hypothetical protein
VLVLDMLVRVRAVRVRVRHVAVTVLMRMRMVVRVALVRHPRSFLALKSTIRHASR